MLNNYQAGGRLVYFGSQGPTIANIASINVNQYGTFVTFFYRYTETRITTTRTKKIDSIDIRPYTETDELLYG